MESSVIVTKCTEFKAEESKNESVVVVAAAVVDHDSGVGKSSSQNKKTKKKKSNRILVSHNKKPFVFYLNLAKRYIKQYSDIELNALGMAIPTVISIAEALKRDGLASHKEVKISTMNSEEDDKGSFIQKAKIQIVLEKAEKLNKTIAATTAPKKTADADVKA